MFVSMSRGRCSGGLRWGLEPICAVLQVSPASVRSVLRRPPSARSLADEALKTMILAVYNANYRVYGCAKIKAALLQGHGLVVDKDRVRRLMGVLGIRGAVRGRRVITTRPDPADTRASDLVKRDFSASGPNQLWVTDFTYVSTWAGMAYVAFIIEVFSRFIVRWSVATSMRTELVMAALEQAVWRRDTRLAGLVAHSDAGSQYTSIRYTDRLAELGAQPSIGTVGDSYDNAMAETTIGLYKTELVWPQGPWRTMEHLELATLAYVEWFNQRRLHGAIGLITPTEKEARYHHNPGRNDTATTDPDELP